MDYPWKYRFGFKLAINEERKPFSLRIKFGFAFVYMQFKCWDDFLSRKVTEFALAPLPLDLKPGQAIKPYVQFRREYPRFQETAYVS